MRNETERRRKMKVLAINGSPRGARGNTERILQPFLEGAREAGAETEVVYLKGNIGLLMRLNKLFSTA
jgi:multimeric flavodoxin WrbA